VACQSGRKPFRVIQTHFLSVIRSSVFPDLFSEVVGSVAEAHGDDGVCDEAERGEVRAVGNPQSGHVRVNTVGDDAVENLQGFEQYTAELEK
jgi:hypothetical protein